MLARQLLLDRAALALPKALQRVGGLQSQYAPTMYVGLWSRVRGFERQDLTNALQQRTVVQGTLLRATIHLVSADDYWPMAIAVRDARRRWWLRVNTARLGEAEVRAAADRVRDALATGGQLTRRELDAAAGKGMAEGVGLWIDLVRIPPSGTWERRRADLYAAAEDWVGPPPDLTIEQAQDQLVRRYLTGFGPAAPADISTWAGLTTTDLAPTLAAMQLRRFRAEDGQLLLDLPRQALPAPENPAPVRFLSTWEAVLLAHARRTLVLREDDRPRIFHTKIPHSMNTFLVDGQVAGTWRYRDGNVDVAPFRALGASTLPQVHEEADRLADFHR